MMKSYRGEFLKVRHTIFYPIHLILPPVFILGVNIFLFLRWEDNQYQLEFFIAVIFQLLSMALPLLSAVICGIVSEQEANANHYQNLLTSVHSRTIMIIGKLSMLMSMCALSIGVVLFGMMMTIGLYWEITMMSLIRIASAGIALWLCSISLYVIHLFLGKRFGIGVCCIFGLLGSMISTLGLYSPFDVSGYFIPQTWAVRVTNTIIQGQSFSSFEWVIRLVLTLVLILGLSISFNFTEERKNYE